MIAILYMEFHVGYFSFLVIFLQENSILKNNIWDYRFNGSVKSNGANRKTLGHIKNWRKLCCHIP